MDDFVKRLNLPDFGVSKYINENDNYGASFLAARYCKIQTDKPIKGIWQHGWDHDFMAHHPALVTQAFRPDIKDRPYYVARKSQENILKQNNYNKAKAIGLPIIYVEPHNYERVPNSLLVMPTHTTDFADHDWNFDAYAEAIDRIKSHFDIVVICLHKSCFEKKFWYPQFKERGFTVIQSVDAIAENDYIRLQKLFSSFEFVTSNGYGSHLAYASFFGAKVSIYGNSFPTYRKEDFIKEPIHVIYPELLKTTYKLLSEDNIRKYLSDFFCHPKEAILRLEWAKKELGYDNKISPKKMKELFGWTLQERFLYKNRHLVDKILPKVAPWVPRVLKQQVKQLIYKS